MYFLAFSRAVRWTASFAQLGWVFVADILSCMVMDNYNRCEALPDGWPLEGTPARRNNISMYVETSNGYCQDSKGTQIKNWSYPGPATKDLLKDKQWISRNLLSTQRTFLGSLVLITRCCVLCLFVLQYSHIDWFFYLFANIHRN